MVDEVNPFDPANDFFKDLADFKPAETKDDSDFKPIKGKYVAIIKKLTHNIGLSTTTNEPYDFYSMNMQVIETVDGDKGENRYLSKRYQNTPEAIKNLMNDLFTAGVPFEKGSREAFDLSLTNAIDKQIRVRAWAWTPDKSRSGQPIAEEDRVAIQQMKVVADFKKSKAKSESVPF